MISEKFLQVLGHEGVASIVTVGEAEPHMVGTWNSYILVKGEDKLYFPAGGMKVTEENLAKNNYIQMIIGSREVAGRNSMGTGFRVKGTAAFLNAGDEYEELKQRFSWARAAVEIKVSSIDQML